MKFEIYRELQDPEEKPVRLRLRKCGSVCRLEVVNEDGDRRSSGTLLTITAAGWICRHESVNSDFGFDLDDKGCVKVEDE